MQYRAVGLKASSWLIAVSLVYGCGDPAKMVPASDGSNEPGTDGPTADTHIDANTTLSPDPLDPVSTPCTGGLRFPGLPTLVNDSSPHFAMADVDGDGHQDVVSWSSVGIRTRRGLGNGMFLAPTVTSAASSATVFTIADTTGDGRPDLVYAVGTDTNIRVAANNGSGGFGAPLLYDVGLLATSVRAVDVNGDGKRDLVAFARGSGNVAVRMNTGTGFGPRAPYNVGGQLTMDFELADLTNDGRPEIVAADLGASTVGVLLNDGSGVFMPRISYPAPSSPTAVAIADMNEDGKLDVVTGTNGTATEVRVSVLLNLGGGVLGAAQNFPTGAHGYPPNVVAVADVNGDGHVDVATSATDVTAQILFGSGTGQLASPFSIDLGPPALDVAFSDLDEDGRPDLLLATSYLITPYLNNGTSVPFELRKRYEVDGFHQLDAVRMIDVDGDNRLDLIALGATNSMPQLAIRIGGANGTFAPKVALAPPASRGFRDVIADFDNDGRQDIVFADGTGQVLLNRGNGTLSAAMPFSLPQQARGIAVGDVNRDGLRDLVISTFNGSGTAGTLQYLQGYGDGTFAPPSTILTDSYLSGPALADLDNDGKLDVVVDVFTSGATFARRSVLQGLGNGTFAAPIETRHEFPVVRFYTRDLNSDGKLDVVGYTSQGLEVHLGNGTLALGAPITSSVGTTNDLAFGDLNGDGKLDVVGAFSSGAIVAVGRGDGSFEAPILYESGGGAASVTLADVDVDGRVDIVIDNQGKYAGVLRGRCD